MSKIIITSTNDQWSDLSFDIKEARKFALLSYGEAALDLLNIAINVLENKVSGRVGWEKEVTSSSRKINAWAYIGWVGCYRDVYNSEVEDMRTINQKRYEEINECIFESLRELYQLNAVLHR